MIRAASVPARARLAGLLYLLVIIGGLFAEVFVRDRLTVSGDPAATARNILAHPFLFRAGFASELTILLCAIGIAVLLYEILQPVGPTVALLATFFNGVSIAVEAVALLFHYGPLVLLTGHGAPDTLPIASVQGLAYASLRMQSLAYNVSLTFFAGFCIGIGMLVWRSSFLPRAIGALLVFAGFAYAVNAYAAFLAPPLSQRLLPWILFPPFVGEASLCLWLLVAGVDREHWERRTAT